MTPSFRAKCLVPSQRVCLRLKSLRESSEVSLDALARYTKINKRYLQALEDCRFDEVKQASIYQKRFIKRYVEALGKNPGPFLKQFAEEELTFRHTKKIHPCIAYKRHRLSSLPHILRYAAGIVVVLALLIYLGNNIRNILRAPDLLVFTPEDGYISEQTTITISGKTEPEIKISINGEQIQNNEQGNFDIPVTLTPGINTIIISAKNKHGKTTEETRHVIYKSVDYFSLHNAQRTEL